MSSGSSYRLKRFQSSRDPEFATALMVYVRNTQPPIRTETNEITYWLDHFAARFGNDFYVFGFYLDEEVVGFAEAAYFREEHLIVWDYLVIDVGSRRNNVFFEFVDHLKRYLEAAHPEYRYAVLELCYGPGQKYPSPEACLLTRLLKLQGFRVIRAPYVQPRMTLDDAESEMRGDLLIYSPSNIEMIRTETYLSIVRTIYYRYYEPWQTIVPEPPGAYKRHLDTLFGEIESAVGRRDTVVVNGHKALLSEHSAKPKNRIHPVAAFCLQALGIVLVVTAAMLTIKALFHISDSSFVTVYGLAVVSFIAIAGVVSKNARLVFAEVASVARQVFGRKDAKLGS